jgi:protein TonB
MAARLRGTAQGASLALHAALLAALLTQGGGVREPAEPAAAASLVMLPEPEPEPVAAAEPQPAAETAPAPMVAEAPPTPPRVASRPRPAAPRPPRREAEPAAAPAAPAQPVAPALPAAAPVGLPLLVTAPRYRQPPAPPQYPRRAADLGITGTVLVRARVAPGGETEETLIWRSSGHPLLDAAALAAVRRWAFEPASIGGRQVSSWVEVPVHFRLN